MWSESTNNGPFKRNHMQEAVSAHGDEQSNSVIPIKLRQCDLQATRAVNAYVHCDGRRYIQNAVNTIHALQHTPAIDHSVAINAFTHTHTHTHTHT